MSGEVSKIGKLLGKRTQKLSSGIVQSSVGGRVNVRTKHGLILNLPAGGIPYRDGDTVLLSNGVITGRISKVDNTPTYMV